MSWAIIQVTLNKDDLQLATVLSTNSTLKILLVLITLPFMFKVIVTVPVVDNVIAKDVKTFSLSMNLGCVNHFMNFDNQIAIILINMQNYVKYSLLIPCWIHVSLDMHILTPIYRHCPCFVISLRQKRVKMWKKNLVFWKSSSSYCSKKIVIVHFISFIYFSKNNRLKEFVLKKWQYVIFTFEVLRQKNSKFYFS